MIILIAVYIVLGILTALVTSVTMYTRDREDNLDSNVVVNGGVSLFVGIFWPVFWGMIILGFIAKMLVGKK